MNYNKIYKIDLRHSIKYNAAIFLHTLGAPMFRRKPLSSTPPTEIDMTTLTHGRVIPSIYGERDYLAMIKPFADHPTYHTAEIIDPCTNIDELHAPILRQRRLIDEFSDSTIKPHAIRSATEAPSNIRIDYPDAKGNWKVTINYAAPKIPEIKIWHPVDIITHDTDGTDATSPLPAKKMYLVVSNSNIHPRIAGASTGIIMQTLPSSIYLLSDNKHTRAHCEDYYRAHYPTAAKTSFFESFQKLLGAKPKSQSTPRKPASNPATVMTISPLHRNSIAEARSQISLVSHRSEHSRTPTTALASAWFASGLRPASATPSSATRWK